MDICRLSNVTVEIPLFPPHERTLKSSLIKGIAAGMTGRVITKSKKISSVQALSDITFTINSGDRIGLIGHNGAGKSTFLRLLSGIFKPSSGEFYLPKPFTPLLDKSFIVSTELTGYSACKAHYLFERGNLKGFDGFLEDVLFFSDIGEFIRMPISGYSEGMKTRLIFSILTYFQHDLLAMDEGLGTGDQSFIDKATDRFVDYVNKAGTLVLASHNNAMLKDFCDIGIVFDQGSMVFSGDLDDALDYYDEVVNQ